MPGAGRGGHSSYVELFKRVQAGGKAVQVWGGIDEIKTMHRELRPDKVFYCTSAPTPRQAEDLLDWFVKNT